MSTLTKVLIVLLTLSTIYLCGSVVTYVATAENYKAEVTSLKRDIRALDKKAKGAEDKYQEQKRLKAELERNLRGQIAAMENEKSRLQTNLTKLERKKDELEAEVNSWVDAVRSFSTSTDDQMKLLADRLKELNEFRKKVIAAEKEINELHNALIEKVTYVKALETEKKQLIEQKTDLQQKLDVLLRAEGGFADVEYISPTPERGKALAAESPVLEEALKGKVTEVNLQNKIVGISIGSADGVEEGMKFYVTRGDDFVCEILIMNVDSKVSAGVIELVSKKPEIGNPKIGDKVATDL